jgi:hypothetical protein
MGLKIPILAESHAASHGGNLPRPNPAIIIRIRTGARLNVVTIAAFSP